MLYIAIMVGGANIFTLALHYNFDVFLLMLNAGREDGNIHPFLATAEIDGKLDFNVRLIVAIVFQQTARYPLADMFLGSIGAKFARYDAL
jgi:hypothetical protein